MVFPNEHETSYEAVSNPKELLHNFGHKRSFKEFICNKDYGLCVYIFKDYIILRPDDVDLDDLFESLDGDDDEAKKEDGLDLMNNFQRILKRTRL